MGGLSGLICYVVLSASFAKGEYICKYSQTIAQAARRYNVDALVILSIIQIESRWNRWARGNSGECGLGQIIPRFYRHFGVTCKKLERTKYSIKMTARIFSYWYHNYAKENLKIALCGYNAGKRCKRRIPNKNGMEYTNKVMSLYGKLWMIARKTPRNKWIKK